MAGLKDVGYKSFYKALGCCLAYTEMFKGAGSQVFERQIVILCLMKLLVNELKQPYSLSLASYLFLLCYHWNTGLIGRDRNLSE